MLKPIKPSSLSLLMYRFYLFRFFFLFICTTNYRKIRGECGYQSYPENLCYFWFRNGADSIVIFKVLNKSNKNAFTRKKFEPSVIIVSFFLWYYMRGYIEKKSFAWKDYFLFFYNQIILTHSEVANSEIA